MEVLRLQDGLRLQACMQVAYVPRLLQGCTLLNMLAQLHARTRPFVHGSILMPSTQQHQHTGTHDDFACRCTFEHAPKILMHLPHSIHDSPRRQTVCTPHPAHHW